MVSRYKIVVFDLDGTLTDPKVGITKSVQYALHHLAIVEPDLEKLTAFIGPPLSESFARYYLLDEAKIANAIPLYREYFQYQGIFENEIYPGITELLQDLKKSGRFLAVATSKPTVFAEQILRYFDLEPYFDLVVGSNLDNTRTTKTEILAEVLQMCSQYSLRDFVMIGDREHDVIGAKNVGIDSIGVTYGYGSLDELKESGVNFMVGNIGELRRWFADVTPTKEIVF